MGRQNDDAKDRDPTVDRRRGGAGGRPVMRLWCFIDDLWERECSKVLSGQQSASEDARMRDSMVYPTLFESTSCPYLFKGRMC